MMQIEPKQKKNEWPWYKTAGVAVGALLALVLFASCVGALARNSSAPPRSGGVHGLPVPTNTVLAPGAAVQSGAQAGSVLITSAAEAATPRTPDVPPGIGEGTYEVGSDVKPGKYKTAGPTATDYPSCYYARRREPDGLAGIIANGNPHGPTTIVIKPTDKFFETSGCAEWVLVAG